MPEGDTIHRAARRLDAALRGRELAVAEAPNPRSPLHRRTAQLEGAKLEHAEARGKHLLAHFSNGLVLHSHLGMNGRWWIQPDGRLPYSEPWVVLGVAPAVASQTGGRLLRLVTESTARNDPGLLQLGPDPLRVGFDAEVVAQRLRVAGRGRHVADALLDQRIVAGVGNAIKNEACFCARIDPWRLAESLSDDEALRLIRECERVMKVSLRCGRRPRSIYRQAGRGCPTCGTPIHSRGQGEANRSTYWCPACQA